MLRLFVIWILCAPLAAAMRYLAGWLMARDWRDERPIVRRCSLVYFLLGPIGVILASLVILTSLLLQLLEKIGDWK